MPRTPKPKPPLERAIVLQILQGLQAEYPRWCWVRVEPSSAIRARAYAGQPDKRRKFKEDAWGDGVADILGIGSFWIKPQRPHDQAKFFCAVAIECKRPGQKQRDTQIAFQARWEAAGGLYMVAHDWDEVRAQFKAWGL